MKTMQSEYFDSIKSQITHYKQVRIKIVRHHKALLRDLDAHIANCEKERMQGRFNFESDTPER